MIKFCIYYDKASGLAAIDINKDGTVETVMIKNLSSLVPLHTKHNSSPPLFVLEGECTRILYLQEEVILI